MAASALLLASSLIAAKGAHAYWDFNNATYAGTGNLLSSGGGPVDSIAVYSFNKPAPGISGGYYNNGNPSFSIGDGKLTQNIMGSRFRFGANTSAFKRVIIDPNVTPSLPVITITLTWIPNPQSDVNNDGFINAADDPAPSSAPTATLRAQGSLSSTPAMMSNSIESACQIATSYRNASGNWISASSINITNPLNPPNYDFYSVSDSQDSTISSYTYSGGVATYQIRMDTYNLWLCGTTDDSFAQANAVGTVNFYWNP